MRGWGVFFGFGTRVFVVLYDTYFIHALKYDELFTYFIHKFI